jgi:serine/threonine-protein phosphatase 2A regulatory subunit A
MVDNTNGLYPIAVMIDELKCEDQKKRIASVKNLSTIAVALGPERTRSELLPYVLELMDDDDEVLVVLAETLSTMLDYAGGPQHAEHVLRPLEKLCTIEETVVREKVSITITLNPHRLLKV